MLSDLCIELQVSGTVKLILSQVHLHIIYEHGPCHHNIDDPHNKQCSCQIPAQGSILLCKVPWHTGTTPRWNRPAKRNKTIKHQNYSQSDEKVIMKVMISWKYDLFQLHFSIQSWYCTMMLRLASGDLLWRYTYHCIGRELPQLRIHLIFSQTCLVTMATMTNDQLQN